MTKKTVLEKKVKKGISKLVTSIWPTAYEFMPVQTGFGKTGVPDHLFCVPVVITQEMVGQTYGMFVGEEAKRFKEKPTPGQYRNLAEITCAGGFAGYTAGLEALPRLEERLKRRFYLR